MGYWEWGSENKFKILNSKLYYLVCTSTGRRRYYNTLEYLYGKRSNEAHKSKPLQLRGSDTEKLREKASVERKAKTQSKNEKQFNYHFWFKKKVIIRQLNNTNFLKIDSNPKFSSQNFSHTRRHPWKNFGENLDSQTGIFLKLMLFSTLVVGNFFVNEYYEEH